MRVAGRVTSPRCFLASSQGCCGSRRRRFSSENLAMRLRHYAILLFVLVTATLSAQTSGLVSGQVLREDGTPAAGATVSIAAGSWYRSVIADDRGRFVMLAVPFHKEYRVSATTKGGYAWAPLGAVYPGIPTTLEFRLHEGPTDGPCGSVIARRLSTVVWFAVPLMPPRLPSICL